MQQRGAGAGGAGGGRLECVDVAKGVAMLSIMVGHMGFEVGARGNAVERLVFLYHVPVFFLLAGYFLSARRPVGAFAADKARRLLVPYAATCALVVVGVLVLGLVGFPDVAQFDRGAGEALVAALYGAGAADYPLLVDTTFIGAVWFLEALFVALVEARLCLGLERRGRAGGAAATVLVCALALGASLSARTCLLPLNLQSGLTGGLFVWLGHLARERLRPLDSPAHPRTLGLALAVTVAGWYLDLGVNLATAQLGPLLLGVPAALCSSYALLALSRAVCAHTPHVADGLAFVGKNSMTVLCLHLVFLDLGLGGFVRAVLGLPPCNLARLANLAVQVLATCAAIPFVKRARPLRALFC